MHTIFYMLLTFVLPRAPILQKFQRHSIIYSQITFRNSTPNDPSLSWYMLDNETWVCFPDTDPKFLFDRDDSY